jgi:hypothetical protein
VSDNAVPGEVTEEDAIALCDPKMLDIDDACGRLVLGQNRGCVLSISTYLCGGRCRRFL